MGWTGRRGSIGGAWLAAIAVVAATLLAPGAPGAQAQEAEDGLVVTGSTTYVVDLPAGVVRTTTELSFLNTVPDRREGDAIVYNYFDAYLAGIQADAVDIAVTTDDGTPLEFSLRPEPVSDGFFQIIEIFFPSDLRYQQTLDVVMTYDLAGFPNRSELPMRVNEAYALVNIIAFGDPGRSTVQVIAPTTAELDLPFEPDVPYEEVEFGADTVLTFHDVSTEEFSLIATAADESRLTETVVTAGDAEIVFQSWPDDPEWVDFVGARATAGILALEEAIGIPYESPGGRLVVRESAAPALEGYGGWFDTRSNRIEVGEDLDTGLLLHELSHGWFNEELTDARWIAEGLAETYANQLDEQGDKDPPLVANGEDFPLNEWTDLTTAEQDAPAEDYGYGMSHHVVDALYDDIGAGGLRAVLRSVEDGRFAYMTDADPSDHVRDLGWQELLDLVTDVGGSEQAESLFREHVVTPTEAPLLDERAAARATYAALLEEGGDWFVPTGVRAAMRRWSFDIAAGQMVTADATLTARDELAVVTGGTGLIVPDFEEPYEEARSSLDLDAVRSSITALAERVDVIASAEDIAAAERTPFEQLALYGEDFTAELDDARAAFASNDVDQVDAVATAIDERVSAADHDGRLRANGIAEGDLPLDRPGLGYGFAAAAVAGLGAMTVFARRRDRRLVARSGGGVVAQLDPAGDASVD